MRILGIIIFVSSILGLYRIYHTNVNSDKFAEFSIDTWTDDMPMSERYYKIPRVRFKTFLKWYKLNPSSWNITSHTFIPFKGRNDDKSNNLCAVVIAPFPDAVIYFIWSMREASKRGFVMINGEYKDAKTYRCKNFEDVVECIQFDIDTIRAQYSKGQA